MPAHRSGAACTEPAEFNGVAQQIEQNLLQSGRVAEQKFTGVLN